VIWNFPAGHAVQFAALAMSENLLAGQAMQRLPLEMVLSASHIPGMHGCFWSQYGCPGASWYLPSGHTVHTATFAVLEKVPARQFVHRVELALELSESYVPGLHG
jgi:hypothetical protein